MMIIELSTAVLMMMVTRRRLSLGVRECVGWSFAPSVVGRAPDVGSEHRQGAHGGK